ncbi:MAG: SDR family NAD(P)-dependent oxidoreductase [Pacificimonas sp.]|jgi:short-subunit dehydrogenase|nr:SDR family NAD(P)-dependent oxidoreductase [Pacificimonas sp.]
MSTRPYAVITGASTGIGFELAKIAARENYDLLIVANEAEIDQRRAEMAVYGVAVTALNADLGTAEGLDDLVAAIGERPVDALVANAGRGLGGAFLDQDFQRAKDVIDVNVTGTTRLLHNVGKHMAAQGRGRILVTGSIAGYIPGAFQAVYNSTKAYLDNLCWALANEWKDSGVTITCLMPGPTDTEFFDRANMEDTPVGQDEDKDDPADVARDGWEAMKNGETGVVGGSFMNKVQAAFAGIIPDSMLAQMHRRMAEPGRD